MDLLFKPLSILFKQNS